MAWKASHALTELSLLGTVQQIRRWPIPILQDDRIEYFSADRAVPGRNVNLTGIVQQINVLLRQ